MEPSSIFLGRARLFCVDFLNLKGTEILYIFQNSNFLSIFSGFNFSEIVFYP